MDGNITNLKAQLEKITGKRVVLQDADELYYEQDITPETLELLARKSFDLLLKHSAVKNLFKIQLEKMINALPQIKNERQAKDIMKKQLSKIDNIYNNFALEKDLTIKKNK